MKRFSCALIALIILSLFYIPLSAAEGCGHLTEGLPVGVDRFFKTVDNDTHAICYICEDCGETVTVSVEAHSVAESDGKCAYCGYKVCLHEFVDTYYSRNDAETHIKGVACKVCYDVTEMQEPHEYVGGICVGCGLQAPVGAPEDPVPPVDGGEEEPPVGGENEPPAEEPPEDGEFIISQFFEEKVLPFIISAGSALVMFIGALVPYIKKAGKYKRLQGIYTATKAENAKYADILASVDFEKFKESIECVLTEDLKKKIAELGNFEPQFEEMKAKMEILLAQMQAMRDGAMNAWAQSPAAVAALSVSPTETAVRKLTKQTAAFEAYIKAQKGEEADEIIAELKGESHDEQGNVPAV